MAKKKILHITTWFPNSFDNQLGIFVQKHIFQCHSFAENVVIALTPHEKASKVSVNITKQSGTTVILGYYPTKKGKKFRNYRNYIACINQIFNLFLDLKFAPDLIHCHIAEKSITIATKYFEDIPILLTEHWSGYIDGRFEKLSSRKQSKRISLLNKCNQILCVSPKIKEYLHSKGVGTSISIIENVIEFKKIKKQQNKDFLFLIVADLVDSIKNVSGVLYAFQKHLSKFKNHELHIIGDGIDREKLQKLVGTLSILDNVSFLGRQDNDFVLEYLPKSDALIVNSYFETYSMITAESLLSGVPVISSKCGGPEQFINNGTNGFTFEKDDTTALITAMEKVTSLQVDYLEIHKKIAQKLNNDALTSKLNIITTQLLKKN